MDAARAAKRLPGVERVQVVYRRSRRYMPADEEELLLALQEGVEFCELLSPVSHTGGALICARMRLGEPDKSGRRSPVETGETVKLPCDLVIAAVGESVEKAIFQENGVALDECGRALVNPLTLESSVPGVYVIGDAHRGPATVVEAIADAQRAADAILAACREPSIPDAAYDDPATCRAKTGVLAEYENAGREFERCLYCSRSCEVCAQVCPNRANIAVRVPGYEMRQIVHIDRMCNECGNCASFCPYPDRPYRDKPTLFHTERDFEDSENTGFLRLTGTTFKVRVGKDVRVVDLSAPDVDLPREMEALMWALLEEYSYLF